MDFYPEAKVIHSVRDPEAWFESCQATIFAPQNAAAPPPEPFGEFFGQMVRDHGGRLHDRDAMIGFFRRWSEEVEASVPAERLLVWELGQGWAPLCAFLGAPVPDQPFPRANRREDFFGRLDAGADEAPSPAKLRRSLGFKA
jgi:hypothetical protein